MPIAPIVLLGLIPTIADTVQIIGWAGLIGGTVGACASGHCPRELVDTRSVPRADVPRADVGPCNVPKYNFDLCHDQLKAQQVQVRSSVPDPGVARFDHVPPACMDLVAVLGGSCAGQGIRPTVCGSACVQYSGLTDVQMKSLALSLKG